MSDTIRQLNGRRGLCRRLRWKSLFLEAQVAPEERGAIVDDGFVWCTHSMNCLGPDGRVASRGSCRAGRGCFES